MKIIKSLALVAVLVLAQHACAMEDANKQLVAKIKLAKTIREEAPDDYKNNYGPCQNFPDLDCAFCEKPTQHCLKSKLDWHVKNDHKLCPVCFIPATEVYELRNHIKKEHPEIRRKTTIEFGSKGEEFRIHVKGHNPVIENAPIEGTLEEQIEVAKKVWDLSPEEEPAANVWAIVLHCAFCEGSVKTYNKIGLGRHIIDHHRRCPECSISIKVDNIVDNDFTKHYEEKHTDRIEHLKKIIKHGHVDL